MLSGHFRYAHFQNTKKKNKQTNKQFSNRNNGGLLGPGDPNFDLYNITCMNFIRSAPAPTERFGPRQQLNQASAYIDGSVVYGYTGDRMDTLRTREFVKILPIEYFA